MSHSEAFVDLAAMLPLAAHEFDRDAFNLLFKCVIGVVFLGMNLLYWFCWRDGQSDYFNALPEEAKRRLLADREEYAPVVQRRRHCQCGYDLQEDSIRWETNRTDELPRCPECFREIVGAGRRLPDAPAVTQVELPETTAVLNPVSAPVFEPTVAEAVQLSNDPPGTCVMASTRNLGLVPTRTPNSSAVAVENIGL